MINKVLETIKKYNLIEPNDKIILGVSGGSDSMSLLHILNTIKNENKISFELVCVTVDHKTRNGESTKDALFVKEECNKLGLKLYTYEIDLEKEAEENKLSCEETGRQFRYKVFNETLIKENANKIATAHNLNDNCETVLLNLIRGTGLNGLCGIPKKNGKIIRPLSNCSKEEILNYVKEENISYKEDYTNSENDFTRNKIRNKVIPYIKENINKGILNSVKNLSDTLEIEKDFLEEETMKAFNECCMKYIEFDDTNGENKEVLKIDIDKLNNYHLAIKKRVIKKAITLINDNSFKDLSNAHIESVIDILKKGTGKQVSILNSILCKVSYDYLLISKGKEEKNELEIINSNTSIIISNNNSNTQNILAIYEEKNNSLALINNVNNLLVKNENEVSKSITFTYQNKDIILNSLSNEETEKLITLYNENKNDFIKLMKEKLNNKEMYFDLDKLIKKTNIISSKNNLKKVQTKIIYKFRSRDDGDKILINNENNYKSLSDLFIDEKIEREERNKFIIFEKIEKDENDNLINNDIVAILGLRVSNKYMITNETKNIIKVKFDSKI